MSVEFVAQVVLDGGGMASVWMDTESPRKCVQCRRTIPQGQKYVTESDHKHKVTCAECSPYSEQSDLFPGATAPKSRRRRKTGLVAEYKDRASRNQTALDCPDCQGKGGAWGIGSLGSKKWMPCEGECQGNKIVYRVATHSG
jgi:Zn finger protein HypA/HybF involved in hydrogenase expression